MKIDFTKKIEEFKEKSDKEILTYLSDFWNVAPNEDGIIRLYASYKKSEHKDNKGNDFAFFVDIRNEVGDILYYPYKLGKVKIWSQYKPQFEAQPIWQINVRLSEQKYRKENPFALCMANNIVGKPSLKFNDRLEKEAIIKKIFKDTGYTQRDAKNTVNALHNIMDDLYTNADDRFVYELLQNADDQPQEGKTVSVFMQLQENHLLFMHNGRPFDKDDVDSICSIGSSTKRNSKEKIGYKGIGFKSVFTGSDTVIVNSGNFSFAFDKYSPLYNDANIESIPWQLKPIWQEKYRYPKEVRDNECFWKAPVGISLNIDSDRVEYFDSSIRKILSNPLFLLFLKNVSLFRFNCKAKELKIAKDEDDNIIHIKENDKIISSWIKTDYVIEIPQDIRDAMQNDRNVPQKMKEATKTQISFAANITDEEIKQINNSVLYAYLPTTVNDFKFNFIVNADFLLAANREQLHTKKTWNRYLFQQIGKLLVEWGKSISAFSSTYLNVFPTKELPEEETGHLTLSSDFNRAYKSALESEAFILNHKNELARQDEIIVDKTGLSEIIGADLFCQLLDTKKCLPSNNIDNKILEEDIFENIGLLRFDNVIEAITNNETFNKWFITASDEQKQAVYKWIKDNNTTSRTNELNSFVTNLPLFQFRGENKSYGEIKASNLIITTGHIISICGMLSKIGFVCSDNVFDENHPLYEFIKPQDDEKLFYAIKECDFSKLTNDERKTLFFALADFDGVGEAKLKAISIFKNMNGDFKALDEMVAYREYVPGWLYPFVICKDDNDKELTKYLISQEHEFNSIIQEHYEDIDVPLAELYNSYKGEWTGPFTRQLIDRHEIDNDLLAIIEESDTETKKYYLNTIKKLEVHSTCTYKKDSYEYRVLQLALSIYEDPTVFSQKIFFDEKCIKDFSVSDEVTCDFVQNGEKKKVKMSLAKLLPQYQNQSDSIEKIKALFESKKDLDKFFVAKPMPLDQIVKGLEATDYLNLKPGLWPNDKNGNAYQYLFYVYYYREVKRYTSSWVISIQLENESQEFIEDMMDFLFNNRISIEKSPFTYRVTKYFLNKHFVSVYNLESEELLSTIELWADDNEKKKYLTENGVRTSQCNTIQFRKLFLENKPINFLNKLSDPDLKCGIEFISGACESKIPFVGTNQKDILIQLKDKKCCGILDNWNDKKIRENSNEWDSKEYNVWIEKHYPHILIYPEALPRQLSYDGKTLLNYDDSEYDYYYDKQTKQLYLCNSRRIEDILFEVAKDGKSDLSFDEYRELCLEGKVSVSKEDIEIKNKTIKSLSEENRKKDEIIEQYRAKYGDLTEEVRSRKIVGDNIDNNVEDHGNASERGNLDENSRIELNLEARNSAKDYLDSLEDYDCSEWNPNTGNGLVKGIVKYKNKAITVVVTSSIGRKLYLHPRLFSELMIDPNNVLLNYGYDRRIHRIRFDETFKDNKDVNLIFDANIIDSKEFAFLANRYMYSKKTCFVIENITYSISEQIKGFGLDEKMSDADVYTNIDTDDLFDF